MGIFLFLFLKKILSRNIYVLCRVEKDKKKIVGNKLFFGVYIMNKIKRIYYDEGN